VRAEYTYTQKTPIGDRRYAGVIYARIGETDVVADKFHNYLHKTPLTLLHGASIMGGEDE